MKMQIRFNYNYNIIIAFQLYICGNEIAQYKYILSDIIYNIVPYEIAYKSYHPSAPKI